MPARSRIFWSRRATCPSSDLLSSARTRFWGGGLGLTVCEPALARPARVTGRSQGASTVSSSRALAMPGSGFQYRGGATTIERPAADACAAIMAVSAVNHCSFANAAACRAWARTPGVTEYAAGTRPGIWSRRVASICVSTLLARRTVSSPPCPSGRVVTVAGV